MLTQQQIASYWNLQQPLVLQPINHGLINTTYQVKTPDKNYILQRVNPIFAAAVHDDIFAITTRLQSQHMLTPTLLATQQGQWFVSEQDNIWRLMTFIEGHTHHRMQTVSQAHSTGLLVAHFHRALLNFDYKYQFKRPQVHDLQHHLQHLQKAIGQYSHHPLCEQVAPLAEEILHTADTLPSLEGLPLHHCHGDLKVSNILYNSHHHALCLLDLDTLGLWPFAIELGDALRSWCQTGPEDAEHNLFRMDLCEAALTGYAQIMKDNLSADEWHSIVPGTQRITLELSSRFLADALFETYFGYDPKRYPTRGAHNLAKAKSQWALFQNLNTHLPTFEGLIKQLQT